MPTIHVNDFARRQTPDSHFAHFAGSWAELIDLVRAHFGDARPGYREGVCLVTLPPFGFYTGLVRVTPETQLVARLTTRQAGEEPYLAVYAVNADKTPARSVRIVLYHHDVLAEDNEATSAAEWEIVAILASPEDHDLPMDPVTMMRNFLHLPGGTQGDFSAMEFATSIRAAQQYVTILPKNPG